MGEPDLERALREVGPLPAIPRGPGADHPERRVNVAAERAIEDLIRALGEDPSRDGLRDTPRRAAAFWQELMHGEPANGSTTSFELPGADEMVMVNGIRVWSVCEHHLLPFSLDVAMAYIASGRVLGLSKFSRIARRCAQGLQIQERVVAHIADELERATGTEHVAVTAKGLHLCMVVRGVRERDASATTSVMRGDFRHKPEARAEFMDLART